MNGSQSAILSQEYISILEKTNQQLSIWGNPYGLAIGILSILVALIAIGTALLLWRNGKEQKEAFQKFLSEQEAIVKKNIDAYNKRLKEVNSEYEELIKDLTNKQKAADTENKQKIQAEIDRLRKERVGLYAGTPPTFGTSLASQYSKQEVRQSIQCPSCNRLIEIPSNPTTLSGMLNTFSSLYCPFCGYHIK